MAHRGIRPNHSASAYRSTTFMMGWEQVVFAHTTERMGLAFVEFARDTSVHQIEHEAFSVLTLLSCAMLLGLLVWRSSSEEEQGNKTLLPQCTATCSNHSAVVEDGNWTELGAVFSLYRRSGWKCSLIDTVVASGQQEHSSQYQLLCPSSFLSFSIT
jgi:hypothetical protein